MQHHTILWVPIDQSVIISFYGIGFEICITSFEFKLERVFFIRV